MAIRTNLAVKLEFQHFLNDLSSDEQDRIDGGCRAIQQGMIDLKTWVARSDRENASPELLNLISYVAIYAQPRFQAGIFNIIFEASPEARNEIDREFSYHIFRGTAVKVLRARSLYEKVGRTFDDGISALLHAGANIFSQDWDALIPLQKEYLLHHAIFLSAAANSVVIDVTHFPLKLTQLVVEYIGGVRVLNTSGHLQADVLAENTLRIADPEVLELYASSGFNPLNKRCHRVGEGTFSPLHPRITLSKEQRQALQHGFQASIPFLDAENVAQLIPHYEEIGNFAWGQESITKLTARQIDWLPAGKYIDIDLLPTILISKVVQSRTPLLRPIADLVASYVKRTVINYNELKKLLHGVRGLTPLS